MIDFKTFNPSDDAPIYLEIIAHIKREIIAGRIINDDIMPSRRVLSSRLGVNPNTIQKSYKLLEDEGIVISKSGTKSKICLTEKSIKKIKQDIIGDELAQTVSKLKHMGLSLQESTALLKEKWENQHE